MSLPTKFVSILNCDYLLFHDYRMTWYYFHNKSFISGKPEYFLPGHSHSHLAQNKESLFTLKQGMSFAPTLLFPFEVQDIESAVVESLALPCPCQSQENILCIESSPVLCPDEYTCPSSFCSLPAELHLPSICEDSCSSATWKDLESPGNKHSSVSCVGLFSPWGCPWGIVLIKWFQVQTLTLKLISTTAWVWVLECLQRRMLLGRDFYHSIFMTVGTMWTVESRPCHQDFPAIMNYPLNYESKYTPFPLSCCHWGILSQRW